MPLASPAGCEPTGSIACYLRNQDNGPIKWVADSKKLLIKIDIFTHSHKIYKGGDSLTLLILFAYKFQITMKGKEDLIVF